MRSRLLLSVVAALGALLVGVSEAPAMTGSRAATGSTWSGTWSSSTTYWGTMTVKQSGASVEGTYTHDEGHIVGTISGNVLTGRWDEAPTRKGPKDAGAVILTLAAQGTSFSGDWNYDGDGAWHKNDWSASCSGGDCTKNGQVEATPTAWQPLPGALVSLKSVSNGCGGGPAGDDPKDGDVSDFVDSEIPFADLAAWERGKKYHVNFREACKQHDAGYSHAKVHDMALNGGKVIDYFAWTKAQVDTKFLEDMLKICDDQIPPTATVALRNCKQSGGFHLEHGAKTRFNVVATTTYSQKLWKGLGFYQQPPRLTDSWSVPGVSTGPWLIRQSARIVTLKWTGGPAQPDMSGEFRGTIISHDNDSSVEGFFVITSNGAKQKPRALKLSWNPKTPDQLRTSTGFTLKRG